MAEQGCYLTSGPFIDRIYDVQQTASSDQFYSDISSYSASCMDDSGVNSYYVLTSTVNTGKQCFVKLRVGASADSTNPGDYVYNGNLVTFNIQNCPIDANVLILLLPVMALCGVSRLTTNAQKG